MPEEPNNEILENILLNNNEKMTENNALLEALATKENNLEPLLEAGLELQDKKGTEIAKAVEGLKPVMDAAGFIANFMQAIKGDKGDTPVKGTDYYTPEEIQALASEIEAKIRVPEDGQDGYTPVKGSDYFTDSEISEIISQIKSSIPTPKDGKDAVVDYESIITEVLSKVRIPKDGKDGKNGKDGNTDTGKDIVKKLEGLKDNERLSYDSLKGLPNLDTFKKSAGQGYLKELADVNFTGMTDGQTFVKSGDKFIPGSGGGSSDHAALSHLDYASSGHTGFQPAGSYLTASDLTPYSTKTQADLLYLGIGAKASDSDLLDGHDTAYFQTALGFTPEQQLTFTSPLLRSTNTISLKGLTGFGTAGQVIKTNATADGLEWGSVAVTGDVMGPATNTDGYIPQWNGANSKKLKDGLAVPAGGLAGLTALGTKWTWNGDTIGVKKTIGSIDNYGIGLITNNVEKLGIDTTGNILHSVNNTWLRQTDYAGTSYVNMFKVNASDEIDCGGTLNIDGYLEGPTDGGAITIFDMPVVSAADNIEQSATLKLDGTNLLKIYSLADGSGGIDTTRVYTYGTLYPRTGSATAGTTPIIMTAGVVNTVPVAGAIEFDGTDLFITI
jgi:hypothetical protein